MVYLFALGMMLVAMIFMMKFVLDFAVICIKMAIEAVKGKTEYLEDKES